MKSLNLNVLQEQVSIQATDNFVLGVVCFLHKNFEVDLANLSVFFLIKSIDVLKIKLFHLQ